MSADFSQPPANLRETQAIVRPNSKQTGTAVSGEAGSVSGAQKTGFMTQIKTMVFGGQPAGGANAGDPNQKHVKISLPVALGILILFVGIVGGGVAYYLSLQNQEIRQQASTSQTCLDTPRNTCQYGSCGSGQSAGSGTCGGGLVCCHSDSQTCLDTPGNTCQYGSCGSGQSSAGGTCGGGLVCCHNTIEQQSCITNGGTCQYSSCGSGQSAGSGSCGGNLICCKNNVVSGGGNTTPAGSGGSINTNTSTTTTSTTSNSSGGSGSTNTIAATPSKAICGGSCTTAADCRTATGGSGFQPICNSAGKCANPTCPNNTTPGTICGCEAATTPIACGEPCGANGNQLYPINCASGTVCGNGSNGGTSGNRCLPTNATGYVAKGGICTGDPNPQVYCINKTDGTHVTDEAGVRAACAAVPGPSPTPATTMACNSACTTDTQCQSANSAWVCYNSTCRLATSVGDTTCTQAATTSSTTTTTTEATRTTVPSSGPTPVTGQTEDTFLVVAAGLLFIVGGKLFWDRRNIWREY